MNRFERSMVQLNRRMRIAGRIVALVYTRKNGDSITIENKAWAGRQAFRVEDNGRSRLDFSDADFMIPVDLLVVNGTVVIPERGDRITVVRDAPTGMKTYELRAPNDEQVFRFLDSQQTTYRCHTKEI